MKSMLALLLLWVSLAGADPMIHAACTDYSTGMLAGLDAYAPWTAHPDLLSIHSDAVLRWGGEYLAVLGRLGADNVLVLDPSTLETVSQFSAGTASNPQDLLVLGEKAYVSRLNENSILVVSWPDGATLGEIDLSAWADSDGYAEISGMVEAEGYVFVAVQRLDRDYYWLPMGDSYLVVLDAQSDTVVDLDVQQPGLQAVSLPAADPAGELHRLGDGIYAACPGIFGLLDGGLVRVDSGTYEAQLIFPESALGGDIGDVAFLGESDAYAITSDASWATQVLRFDPENPGGGTSTVASSSEWVFSDLELQGGQLFVSDQSYAAEGVRVYDAASGAPLSPAISLGLPPFDLLAPREVTPAEEAPQVTARLGAWPNPFNPRTTISWTGLPAGFAELHVYDIKGRRVARILSGGQPGEGSLDWRAEGLSSGVYLARLSCGGLSLTRRLVLLQ